MRCSLARRVLLAVSGLALVSGVASRLPAGENYAFLVAVGEYDRTELKPLQFTRPEAAIELLERVKKPIRPLVESPRTRGRQRLARYAIARDAVNVRMEPSHCHVIRPDIQPHQRCESNGNREHEVGFAVSHILSSDGQVSGRRHRSNQ